jgi:Rrf2 family iron-sulfur cluster assembly transcriptional regulator
MLYSKTCEYALRSLVYLCHKGIDVFVGASEISKEIDVPQAYLAKIFQALVRAGILKSRRGVGGGVALCPEYQQLTLMQIIEAIDDLAAFKECAMGLDHCDAEKACPLHDIWSKAKEEIISKFTMTTLLELTRSSKKFKYAKMSRARLKASMS